jgi:O-antigen/teichoic acid export membrane protein
LAKKIVVNTVFSLQIFQILRFTVFLLISVLFAKKGLSGLNNAEIGDWEQMTFITSAISFFWIAGITQSLIPLYNNNSTFETSHRPSLIKSPELFNAFILLTLFSFIFTFIILFSGYLGFSGKSISKIPYHNLLAVYFFFNNPGALIEYIYLLKNKPKHILVFGISSFFVQLFLVCGPVLLGWGLVSGILGLVVYTLLRYGFLIYLLVRYAKFEYSWSFIKNHLNLGYPLILSSLLSGSSQYVDGLVASITGDSARFAVFRFGAKELPFVSQLANGLSNAMLTGFSCPSKLAETLQIIKKKSLRLMHYLFPLTVIIMVFSKWIYNDFLFNPSFNRSADLFMVYLLMIMSRLVFPQTILIGLKKTKIVLAASVIKIILNLILSIALIQPYGIVGIALGSIIVHVLEKIYMIAYNYYKLEIKPNAYIPLRWYVFYSSMLSLIFVLIDHRIIKIY